MLGIRAGGWQEPLAANTAIKHRRHDRLLFFKYICSLLSCLLAVSLFFSFCYDSPCGCCVCPFLTVLLSSFFFFMSALLSCAIAQRCRLGEDWVGSGYTIPYHGPTHLQSGPTAVVLPTLTGSGPQASRGCVYLLTPIHACPKRSMAVFLCFPGAAGQGERTCADPVCQDDQ